MKTNAKTEKTETFFVLGRIEKSELVFLREIHANVNTAVTGPYDEDLTWTEANEERLVNMKLEYDLLEEFQIFEVTKTVNFTFKVTKF